MSTGFKVPSLASKCVFWKPENSSNEEALKLNFEDAGMLR